MGSWAPGTWAGITGGGAPASTWDGPELLARMKRYMRRPSSDTAWADPDLYALLSEAEQKWKPILAIHDPTPMVGAPVLLTSSDSGLTYDMPSGYHYIWAEVLESLTGTPLAEGPFWSPSHDYVNEGSNIRMCRGTAKTFADGPYLRGVVAAGDIDGATGSTIFPAQHCIVVVFDAMERWASIGGQMDPAYFSGLLQKAVYGDPMNPGDIGILGSIKARNPNHGMAASYGPAYWRGH